MIDECAVFFCGAGLATAGLTQAGFRPVVAIDCDEWAATSHNLNFSDHPPVVIANLQLGSAADLPSVARLGQSWDGLAWLSPPCQPFSMAGKKDPARDLRSKLLLASAEVAEALPRAWVVTENVAGLLKGNSKPYLDDLLARHAAAGRRHAVWRLKCEDWVPNRRPRVFIVAAPVGFPGEFPVAPKVTGRARPTMAQVIGPGFEDVDPEFVSLKPLEYLLYRDISPGGNWESTERGSLARRYAGLLGIGPGERRHFLRRPGWSEPAPALTTNNNGLPGRISALHPGELRGFTVGEARALMGVPSRFVLGGNVRNRMKQVGNGVPPPVARAVAKQVLAASGR
ncbi:MAG: DNA cytosine methyltransferase [Planctomycetota bacterium]|nr:DNA cytosine methyltransferase [Planctomycetota bacterium]